jgi:peptide-methionine (R)-S-oxide reductase
MLAGRRGNYMITRREIVLGGTAASAVIWLARLSNSAMAQAASLGKFEVVKSDEEWRRELTSEQYAVLRRRMTEHPWTSSLNKESRPGTYLCAGCDLPLFSSNTKFESETGWPSFWAPINGASEHRRTEASISWSSPRSIATAAEVTWDMFSTTARRRPASDIA